MSIPRFTEDEAISRLSPERGWASIQTIGSLIFYGQNGERIVSAVSKLVGEPEPRDYGVSLGEWAEIYLDLAGIKPYTGTNLYATETLNKLRHETAFTTDSSLSQRTHPL